MTPTADDRARIRAMPLFTGLDDESFAVLTDGMRIEAHDAPAALFTQGDPAAAFFALLDGRVTIFALTEAGHHAVIEVFDRPCTFAEAAIFSSGVYPLFGAAAAGTRLARIPAAPFLRRLGERPALALALLDGLARWQAQLADEIFDLKRRSPAERLARVLLDQAAEDGEGRVRLPLAKALLARRIGITPESLSRALARLRAHGVAPAGRDAVDLVDRAALRRFVEQADAGPPA